jgi:hypothetical protein
VEAVTEYRSARMSGRRAELGFVGPSSGNSCLVVADTDAYGKMFVETESASSPKLLESKALLAILARVVNEASTLDCAPRGSSFKKGLTSMVVLPIVLWRPVLVKVRSIEALAMLYRIPLD